MADALTEQPFTPEALREAHAVAQIAAEQMRFPFGRRTWRGQTGSFQGAGAGSSIDFQDHRPYLPGDDIRHINWQAYARTGHYILKLYREEVRPTLDLIVDLSRSMFLTEAKTRRTLELAFFGLQSGLQADANVRCFMLTGGGKPVIMEARDMLAYRWDAVRPASEEDGTKPLVNQMTALPMRQGAMRVLISDLLSPEAPAGAVSRLITNNGRGILLAPYCQEEAQPDWTGTVEFEDCESRLKRVQKTPADLVERYRKTYLRHFDLWKHEARRYDFPLARVSSEANLIPALEAEALRADAVELWS